ncbi:TPA: hypothetical protein ACH3X2_010087 [Trebouxia sp. C0005]
MVQGQLDDNTEFGDLLELQGQIRALQTELAEVKQADDEELDKLLDQHAEMQISIAQARSAQEQAVQAVQVAGQKIAQLETANAELRVSNRQLKVQADESSSKHATKLNSAEQEASSARQAALTTQSELRKVQASHDQVASKLSLAEMQLVELQAKRLEGLQAADTVKQQAVQLASSKSQAASALAAQKAAEQVSQEKQAHVAKLEANLQESQAKLQQAEGQLQKQGQQLRQQAEHLQGAHAEVQTLQQSLQDTTRQLQDTTHSLQHAKQSLQRSAQQLQESQQLLQGTQQHLQDAQAANKAAGAAHHAEVDQLRQDLVLAQQTLHDHRHRHPQRSHSRASSQGPSQEAPASIGHQQDDRQLALLPTIRQGDDEAGLSQEVGALRGLLARVAPQLEELVGVKQQMSHLLSALQPGASGSGQQRQGMGGGSQAVATMSNPEAGAPSAIIQMAKSPNPFAAMHNAEPPLFPRSMFPGLNAIANPFSGLNAISMPFSNPTSTTVSPFSGLNTTSTPFSNPTSITVSPFSGLNATSTPFSNPMSTTVSPFSGLNAPSMPFSNPTSTTVNPFSGLNATSMPFSNPTGTTVSPSSGLTATRNPLSISKDLTMTPLSNSSPSNAAAVARSAPATTGAADTHAATTAAAAPANAAATAGARPLPAAITAAAPNSSAPATAMLAVPTAVAAQLPFSTPAIAVTAGVPVVTCCPLSQVATTMEMLSTDVLSSPRIATSAQPTLAVPAGLSLQPATEAAVLAGAAAAPAAGVAMLGTAPLLTDTAAPLSQTQVADSAAVPVQTQAADSAAVPVRNASKRKWDAMTRPKTASVTVLTAAAPVAPVPSSSTAATINSTAAPTDVGTASAATSPALPAATAQALPAGAEHALAQKPCSQSVNVSEASQPQPASQTLEAASKQIEAASKALAGKEIAAKLAAGFAEQHRSGRPTTARAPPTNTISSTAPGPINLSEAVQIAAAAAAEKLIRDQASKARLSVQSSGDTHAARMEAIRLRNLARHDVPEAVALPLPPPQPDTTAVAAVDRPRPAAQASAATDQPQSSPSNSSKGKSKARKKRSRELAQVPWDTEEMPGLRGNPVEFAMSGAGGRSRTDSPASGDTWGTVRQQTQSPGTQQAYKKRSRGSPVQHSNTSGALRSTRGQGHKSPRGRGAASPRQGRSPHRPSGKAAHWEGRQPQGSAYAAERASDREAYRAHSSSGGHSPRRHSGSAERTAKQASLSRSFSRSGSGSGPEDRRRAGSGGAPHKQPSQRSLSLLGPRPSTPSPVVAETGMPLLSKLATLPAHLQGGFVLGASLRVDSPRGAIKPNQALGPSLAEAAAAEVAQGGGEVAEEAEEGELEPGERGADWESDPEDEAGSQAEPAEASGTTQPSTAALQAVKSQQNVDKTLPALQHTPPGAGTPPTQRPDLAPAPQSGYHGGGNPATAVGRRATAVKYGQATSGGSQSTVSQKSATKGADSTEAPDADSHPPSKRSRLSNSSTAPAKASGVVTSTPSSTAQPTHRSSSSGTSQPASKGVAEAGAAKPVTLISQKATINGSEPPKVAMVNPPGPPPGSPTASSTIQEVPPPPPAIPLPPQLQSPSSSRSRPAASYGKQVVAAIPAPAQPAKPVSHQLPAQQLRQQAPRQPLLPAGVQPMGPLPVIHAPQRSHVTHMERQDPPQVQLPASLAARNHVIQPLQAVPAHSQLGHGMQQQPGAIQPHHHRQPQQGLAGQQQPGLISQQHGQVHSGMHQGAAELPAEQRQLQHERALQGQLPPAQLLMGQQEAGQFYAGQPHPWQQQQQQPHFQGGPTQQMGPMRPGQQGGGFQAHFGALPQQPQQYHQELRLPPPVSLSQPLLRHSGAQSGSLQGLGENEQQLPAGMQPPWLRPTFPR